ncbi:SMI1/KNR4 family protein [Aquimarina rhabdastrellae]
MNKLNQIERIKVKLRLAKNTDSFFEVFGASSHKYILSSPLNIKELNDFEEKYNIILPDSYKRFLSEIGNGGLEYKNSVVGNSGAGPDYGIFKLGHPFQFIVDTSLNYLEKEPFFNENTTEKEWNRINNELDDNISDEDYDAEVAKAYSGILNIGFSGCSGYLGIILNGKNKDRVVHTYDEIEYCPHFLREANFLDWYENWLDEVISGKSIKQTGFTNESEESCINRFLSDKEPYWKYVSLAYLRSFDKLNDTSIKTLYKAYKKEKDKNVKLYILNLLTKFDYDNIKEEIAKLARKKPIEFLRNIHLYNKEKSIDWLNEINKIKKLGNLELLEYIEYITDSDIKTIYNNNNRCISQE